MHVLRLLGGVLLATLLVLGGAAAMRMAILNVVAFTDSLPVFTGCQVLYSGASPYAPEATTRIQDTIRARVPRYDFIFDQHRFAYPAHLCLWIAPFALFPYDTITPYWLLLNFVSFALLPLVFYHVAGVRVKPLWLVGMVFVSLIGWRYSMIHIILGQFVFLVLWAMLGAVAALRYRRDLAAGACLALMTVRPEGFFLMLPLLGYALWQRRWKVLVSTATVLGGGVLATFALAGVWVGDFLVRLGEYGSYRQQATLWLPSLLGAPSIALASAWLAALAWRLWLYLQNRTTADQSSSHGAISTGWALSVLCVAQFLLLPQTNTYTLIYALLPFFWVIAQLTSRRKLNALAWGFVGATLAGIWAWQAWGGKPYMLDALLLPLWLGVFVLALPPSGLTHHRALS